MNTNLNLTTESGATIQAKDFVSAFRSVTFTQVWQAAAILVLGLMVIWFVMRCISRMIHRIPAGNRALSTFLSSVVRVVLYLLLFSMVFGQLGVPVSSVVALLSLLMLAISLSVQNVLTNVVSGIVVLTTRPFVAGDFIETPDASGSVESISLTYTHLKTPDNRSIMVPNSTIAGSKIINYSVNPLRRVDLNFRLDYEYDTEKVIAALLRCADQQPAVLHEEGKMPAAVLNSYLDNGIQYTLRVWAKKEDYWTVHQALQRGVRKELEKDGIRMNAAPTPVRISEKAS